MAQTPDTRSEVASEPDADTGHLGDVEDSCGCAEVWEHLSAARTADPLD